MSPAPFVLNFVFYHSMWSRTRSQMTSIPGMITYASSPAPRNAAVMRISLSISITLREGGDGVCPGLYFREDRVVHAGRDTEPVAGEIHVVNLAVRVVAPERLRAGLVLGIADCTVLVGCCQLYMCRQRCAVPSG